MSQTSDGATSPPKAVYRCCGAACWAEESQDRNGPCWGDVQAVDEEYDGDSDSWTVHGCEGHANSYEGPYIPKANQ